MRSYYDDVEIEARDFMRDNDGMFKQAIVDGCDFDPNDISDLDQTFHESITDRAYSLSDAAFIIENSNEVENDSGLWEGQEPREALSTQAAFTFHNDVWFECEKIYNELKEQYEEEWESVSESSGDDDDWEERAQEETIDRTWKEYFYGKTLTPVQQNSFEELYIIEKWFKLNENAGMWGGYPLGGSYIDSRCGSGHGMSEIKEYVDFDQEARVRLPWLAGKFRDDVRIYCNKLRANLEVQ